MTDERHSEEEQNNTPTIQFNPGDEKPWVMKIENNNDGSPKVKFNYKDYPNVLPDEFARAVARILCRSGYLKDIWFEEKKND